jgi:hypothetical protein
MTSVITEIESNIESNNLSDVFPPPVQDSNASGNQAGLRGTGKHDSMRPDQVVFSDVNANPGWFARFALPIAYCSRW